MRIYLAGKITGLCFDDAVEHFGQAEDSILDLGHEPLNPIVLVDQAEGRTYEDCLLDALRIVLEKAEAVYMLHNWRDSKGARIEHAIAEILGKPIYYHDQPGTLPDISQ